MMVVILQDNLTVTKPADFVLEVARLKLTVLEHKEPIAWLTVFASTAEMTLIVEPTMLGAETEFQELFVETLCVSLPVIPILMDKVLTHAVLINLTATATELVFDALMMLVVLEMMDLHQEVQTQFVMLLESVLTHGFAPLVESMEVMLTILDVKLTTMTTTTPTATKTALAPTVKQMLVVKPTMVVLLHINLDATLLPEFVLPASQTMIVQHQEPTVTMMALAKIADKLMLDVVLMVLLALAPTGTATLSLVSVLTSV